MVPIDVALVQRLLKEQFPEWSHLEVKPDKNGGHDNRTFHLGESMSVSLPSAERYVPQVEKEHKWITQIRSFLCLKLI